MNYFSLICPLKGFSHYFVEILDKLNTTPLRSLYLKEAPINFREIIREALKHNAGKVVFAHNHPPEDPSPTKEDKKITRKLVAICREIDIEVIDHVILGETDFFSFRRNGLLD